MLLNLPFYLMRAIIWALASIIVTVWYFLHYQIFFKDKKNEKHD